MKISIIIPVYNVEQYIEECLNSVANQTMTEGLECIIVDDCGQDNSMEIARQFVNRYNGAVEFRIVYREKNGGLSAARNTGIEAAQGEYVYFLDSDDTILPECMELMYGYIEKYGKVDLVQGSFYETEEERVTASTYRLPEYSEDKKQIKTFLLRYEGDIIPAQSRLVLHDFLLSNNLFFREGIIHEDNYWTFFLAKHVSTMSFCPVRTYYHRYNPNSITGNVNKKKEYIAYRTILSELSNKIDKFLNYRQKEYLANNLLTAINSGYYSSQHEKDELIKIFLDTNTNLQRCIFNLLLNTRNPWIKSKLLHALVRLYKF